MEKRQKLKELSIEQKKNIDRKATKGRKIKYVVLEKIMNFMVPEENLDEMEGREAILENLFGKNMRS